MKKEVSCTNKFFKLSPARVIILGFLAIIFVLDDNNLIRQIKNRATINELTSDIKAMETDSTNIQTKLNLYTGKDLGVMEDEARKRGSLKKDEEAFIIE